MRSSEYSDQHLLNAVGYHERKIEELRDELESRGVAETRTQFAHPVMSESSSMLEHRVRVLGGRIASAERKLTFATLTPKKPTKRPSLRKRKARK